MNFLLNNSLILHEFVFEYVYDGNIRDVLSINIKILSKTVEILTYSTDIMFVISKLTLLKYQLYTVNTITVLQ